MYTFFKDKIFGFPACKGEQKKRFIDFVFENEEPRLYPNLLLYFDYAINSDYYSNKTTSFIFSDELRKRYGDSVALKIYDKYSPRLKSDEILEIALLFLKWGKDNLKVHLNTFGIFVDYNNRNKGALLKACLESPLWEENESREYLYCLLILLSGVTVGTKHSMLDVFEFSNRRIENEKHFENIKLKLKEERIVIIWKMCKVLKISPFACNNSRVSGWKIQPKSISELLDNLHLYYDENMPKFPNKDKEIILEFLLLGGVGYSFANVSLIILLHHKVSFLDFLLPLVAIVMMWLSLYSWKEGEAKLSSECPPKLIVGMRIYLILCICFPSPYILIPFAIVAFGLFWNMLNESP